jgi:hypothetical protein
VHHVLPTRRTCGMRRCGCGTRRMSCATSLQPMAECNFTEDRNSSVIIRWEYPTEPGSLPPVKPAVVLQVGVPETSGHTSVSP